MSTSEAPKQRVRGTIETLYFGPRQTVLTIEDTTRAQELRDANNHLRPLPGKLPLSQLDSAVFDSFHAKLRIAMSVARAAGTSITAPPRPQPRRAMSPARMQTAR